MREIMATRVKIKTLENSHTHFDFEIGGNNYTLCGLDTLGDTSLGLNYPVKVKRKVNCPTCITIVKFCHAIRSSEFED